MFLVRFGEKCAPERAEADSSCCNGDKPLGIEMKSRSVKIRLDFLGCEYEISISFLDHEGTFLFSPEFPGHDLFLAFRIIVIGVTTQSRHILIITSHHQYIDSDMKVQDNAITQINSPDLFLPYPFLLS
jgi:hypothetical protein